MLVAAAAITGRPARRLETPRTDPRAARKVINAKAVSLGRDQGVGGPGSPEAPGERLFPAFSSFRSGFPPVASSRAFEAGPQGSVERPSSRGSSSPDPRTTFEAHRATQGSRPSLEPQRQRSYEIAFSIRFTLAGSGDSDSLGTFGVLLSSPPSQPGPSVQTSVSLIQTDPALLSPASVRPQARTPRQGKGTAANSELAWSFSRVKES